MHAVTTHNPFAVNDLYFASETGIALEDMNPAAAASSSVIRRAPPGCGRSPNWSRRCGPGWGARIVHRCAAGDTGAAIVLEVDA